MSKDNRSIIPPDPEHLVEEPLLDEEECAEATWLLEREQDPSALAPSPTLQREYTELEDLLGNLSPMVEDHGWQQEVLHRATTPRSINGYPLPVRRRAMRWVAGATLAVTAAVLALVILQPRPPSPADDLRIELRRGDQVRSDQAEAAIGDTLVIQGSSLEAGDLRVFRGDGTPAGWCPNGPGCSLEPGGKRSLEIELDRPIEYRVIFVTGMPDQVRSRTWSEYLAEVRARSGNIVLEKRLEVH